MKALSASRYQKIIREFCAALKKHDHFLLACHVLPEGDAIGSILALDSLLRRLGKKTTIVADDAHVLGHGLFQGTPDSKGIRLQDGMPISRARWLYLRD